MSNPSKQITVFSFYCNSFEELPSKMKEEVGYEVKPKDVWSINITNRSLNELHIVLTILYWKEN